jgi:RNA polymerase sigma-70 factor (ECF subfamily)
MKTTKTYKEMTNDFLKSRSGKDFAVLYNRIKPGLTSHIYKIVKDWDVAEDIAVNSLCKMWTKIDQYNPNWQITTWLYKIGFNASLGYLNERNKTQSLDAMKYYGVEINNDGATDGNFSEDVSIEEMTEEDNEFQLKYDMTVQAIHNLKSMYKDILLDRMLNGVKYKDLAEKYELPLQTIKNRVRRGKVLIAHEVNENLAVCQ